MKTLWSTLTVAALLALAVTARGAPETASSFHLVFDGMHNADLLHEGTFTTSLASCASGTAVDIQVDDLSRTVVRRFACSGSGDAFTARVTPFPAEHAGNGTWQIVAGSGGLADLRGMGTWSSVRLAGNATDPFSITFRSTWDGVADLDVSAPTVAVSSSRARRLPRPRGTYELRTVLALGDAPGNAVSYRLTVTDTRKPSNPLGTKTGATSAGSAAVAMRVRPAKGTRVLRLKIEATDPVGNAATSLGSVRLPS